MEKTTPVAAKDSKSVIDLAAVTRDIISRTFEELKTTATVREKTEPRFFFPNGIELIDVRVEVNPTSGIEVEIKVAGEKGVPKESISTPLETP